MRRTSPSHPVDILATSEVPLPPGRYLVDPRRTVVHVTVRELGVHVLVDAELHRSAP